MSEDWSPNLREHFDRLSRAISPEAGQVLELKGGERREVTILFLDIVGFTRLSEKLQDPERVYHVIGGVFGAFAEVIRKHNGNVEKYIGDAIMAVWGSEQATEQDAERTIAAAREIFETLKPINRILKSIDVQLNARIGINAGQVVFDKDRYPEVDDEVARDWMVIGDAVNTAARIESSAEHGSILISSTVREHAGEAYIYQDKGLIKVKGKEIPLHVFKVTGKGPGRKSPWERVALVQRSPMVGREKELKALRNALEAETVENIRGFAKHRLVGIEGEAGLGKSRLCFEFTKSVDATVLKGQTLPYAQPAYWSWIVLLRGYFNIKENDPEGRKKLDEGVRNLFEQLSKIEGTEKLRNDLQHNKPFLGRLLGIDYEDDRFKEIDEEAQKLETYLSLRYLLEATAKINKLIVLLEDYQWIDTASADAFKFILENTLIESPILFICPYRPEGSLPDAHSNYIISEEIKLQLITEESCRDLLKFMLDDSDLPVEAEKFILERAAGNPFFLEEALLSLVQKNIIVRAKDTWELAYDLTEADIPRTLSAVILSRFDDLDPILKEILKRASVLGREFLMRALVLLNEKLADIEGTKAHLEILEKTEVVLRSLDETELSYYFKHAIARDVAYETILLFNRRMLHKVAAEIMEEMFADTDQYASLIAHHWHSAELYPDKALEWANKALKYCRSNYQNNEAITWTRRIQDWLATEPESEERDKKIFAALEAEESLYNLMGRSDDRLETLNKMMEIGEKANLDEVKNRTYILYGYLYRHLGKTDEALSSFQKVLTSRKAASDRLGEAHVLDGLGGLYGEMGQSEEALRYYQKAEDIFKSEDNKKGLKLTIRGIGNFHVMRGYYDKAMKNFLQVLEMDREFQDRKSEASTIASIGSCYWQLGKREKALKYLNEALSVQQEIGDRSQEAYALAALGNCYIAHGTELKAVENFEKAVQIFREVGNRSGEAIYLGNLGATNYYLGNTDEAIRIYRITLKITEETGATINEGFTLTNLGFLYHMKGWIDESFEAFRKALKIAHETGDKNGESFNLAYHGRLLQDQGDYKKAREFFDKSVSICRELKHPRMEYRVGSFLGMLNVMEDRIEEAKALYNRSLEIIEQTNAWRNISPEFRELREKLLEAGVPEEELPEPKNWEEGQRDVPA
ncbi:MAG: tetratricopeptide repeat protein [Candidatus Hatepunaea meridiana]|nr:tetratricopeptide repeat protein [Candidatus Hatepunaea meridiana]